MEYFERQQFTQWWLWLILAGVNLSFWNGCYVQLIKGTPWGNNPMSNTALIIVALLLVLLSALFIFFRLDTLINKQGIYVRLFPFQIKYKFFDWKNVSEAYIRQYSPLKEYGGWGYRETFNNSTAYNVSGKVGLQLVLKNNKKVLIGTRQPEKLQQVLDDLGKSHQ